MIIDADAHWAPQIEVFKDCLTAHLLDCYQKDNCSYFATIQNYKDSLANDLNVDRQLLNVYGPSIGLLYNIPGDISSKVAESYNCALEKICQENQEFDYTSWLPLQDISQCDNLLNTHSVQNSFAIHMGEQVPLGFAPLYFNLLSSIGKMKLPIYLHFSGHFNFPPGWKQNIDQRYFQYHDKYPTNPQANIGDNPTWKITLASFILSGVLEKFDLKIIVAEHGLEWLPEFCETMIEISGTDPMPYFKKFFWFTTEPEEKNFLGLSKEIGFDRLLFATDWPHGTSDIGGANMFNDVDLLKNMLWSNRITQQEYDQITHQNYIKLKNKK